MTSIRRRGFLALAPIAAGVLTAPAIVRAQSQLTLADTMAGDTRFSRFLDLITRATAVEDFRQASNITVFAPVDQAFAGAPGSIIQQLTGQNRSGQNEGDPERQRLLALIRNHVVPGSFASAEISGSDRRLRTANGGDIQISGSPGSMTVRNPAPGQQMGAFGAAGLQAAPPAEVLGAPVTASNGVIYPISQIIWP